MHSTRDKEKQWKAEWGALLELAHGSSNVRGVAMLLRNGFDCKIEQKYVDPAGKYVGVQAQISDENYYIQRLLLAVVKKDDIAYENG